MASPDYLSPYWMQFDPAQRVNSAIQSSRRSRDEEIGQRDKENETDFEEGREKASDEQAAQDRQARIDAIAQQRADYQAFQTDIASGVDPKIAMLKHASAFVGKIPAAVFNPTVKPGFQTLTPSQGEPALPAAPSSPWSNFSPAASPSPAPLIPPQSDSSRMIHPAGMYTDASGKTHYVPAQFSPAPQKTPPPIIRPKWVPANKETGEPAHYEEGAHVQFAPKEPNPETWSIHDNRKYDRLGREEDALQKRLDASTDEVEKGKLSKELRENREAQDALEAKYEPVPAANKPPASTPTPVPIPSAAVTVAPTSGVTPSGYKYTITQIAPAAPTPQVQRQPMALPPAVAVTPKAFPRPLAPPPPRQTTPPPTPTLDEIAGLPQNDPRRTAFLNQERKNELDSDAASQREDQSNKDNAQFEEAAQSLRYGGMDDDTVQKYLAQFTPAQQRARRLALQNRVNELRNSQ
jgi:hypothetical protein